MVHIFKNESCQLFIKVDIRIWNLNSIRHTFGVTYIFDEINEHGGLIRLWMKRY